MTRDARFSVLSRHSCRLTGLSVLSSILLILTFPRFNFYLLAPVALTPILFVAAREPRHWPRFLHGWIAGAIYWVGVCYWIQDVLATHGSVAPAASWLALVVFAVTKALHLAVFTLLAGLLIQRAWTILAVPALWVAIEATHGSLGFAWLNLGNAGITMDIPMRLAPLTGVWGLSFLFAMSATALALVALRRPRWQLLPILLLPALYLLPQLPLPERGRETAALIQPNISESAAWTSDWIDGVRRRLMTLSNSSAPGAGLIVWPEIPAPIFYFESDSYRASIDGLAQQYRAYLLLNVVPRDSKNRPYNSALLISPDGQPIGRYDKINLVPFGEFVPALFKPLVNKVSSESGDFVAGRDQVTLPAGPHRLGVFICYESVFPNFVRKFSTDGASLFVNISNDGWYGTSAARFQHLQIVRMRAAENRRWILRATNDGITSTIDPAGRVAVLIPNYTAAATQTSFNYVNDITFYARHGDWFPILCAVIALVSLFRVTQAVSPAN